MADAPVARARVRAGSLYEYVELYNITDQPVVLKEYDPDHGMYVPWEFTDGIDFVFPMDITIPGYGYLLVVNTSETNFRLQYPSVPGGVEVLGPFENGTGLSNGGEKVEIGKPGETEGTTRFFIRIDRVNYDDTAPWPTDPDGNGPTLKRINPNNYGNDVINWQSAAASPGQ